ncbi:hypothetical protein DAPPUDRAFT_256317 [Daphnia pulex]|uniref:Uncharacterized protein n=1 Tax=Daphnia pulex TaxID=6669 RepID=E9HB38_DAPPU|nr:hypothetical protein DAPPUDRAFT_256317 [Daphnia pulex]|eukprot:EFX71018.1 hypothetical protein DAPPUDRAFT_256317 [Daphnia pulex]
MQHQLTAAWEKYNDKKLSSKELLQFLGKLNRKHSQKEWQEVEESGAAEEVESD